MTATNSKSTDVSRLADYQSMSDKDILGILMYVEEYFQNIGRRRKPDMKKFQEILEETLFFEHASPAVRVFSMMWFFKYGCSKYRDPAKRTANSWGRNDNYEWSESQWDHGSSKGMYDWFYRLVTDVKRTNTFYLSFLATPDYKHSFPNIYRTISNYTDKKSLMDRYGEDYLPVLQAAGENEFQATDDVTKRLLCLQPWKIPSYGDFLERQDNDLFVMMGCIQSPEAMLDKNAIPDKFINAKIIKILMRYKSRSYGGKRLNGKIKKWLLTLNENVITSLIEDTNNIDDLYIINNMLNTAFGDKYLTAVASKINMLM